MKPYSCDPTKNTPEIRFDIASSRFSMKGKSFPENSKVFYAPFLEWISSSTFPQGAVIDLEFDYISSSSVIAVLEVIKKIEEMQPTAKVIWTYESGDDDMLNVGQNYQKLTKLHFEFNELEE
jgi:hypothetical protein